MGGWNLLLGIKPGVSSKEDTSINAPGSCVCSGEHLTNVGIQDSLAFRHCLLPPLSVFVWE